MVGCVSSKHHRTNTNIPSVQPVPVEFEDLDLNEDGDVSVSEVKKFNEMSRQSSPAVETRSPTIITVSILGATLLMCLLCAIMKCKKSE